METFLKAIGLSESNFNTLIGILGFILALASAIIPAIRRLISRVFYKILGWLGFTRWVYRKRFLERHSKLHNIYLDKEEVLDLRATYIPLHIDRPGHIGRMPAVALLADSRQRRLIIVGDPGTGKTTLLKAFGTGILRPFSGLRLHDAFHIKQMQETPILVDLRHFASHDFAAFSLVQYITDHIFQTQMKVKDGAAFLQMLLDDGRCLLLLDGLDEVSEEYYESVKNRISAFCNGHLPDFETRNARVIMSCRKQNFERLRRDWVPQTFREVVTLVPFNTDEVYSFLTHRKSEFREGRTPDAFFKQIQASNMAELHRNPLILTISLGLFLNTPHYEIPNSVAQFYETIIKHLLHRHDFRTEPHVKKVNKYNADDKYRFLRELAMHVAEREEGFDEFSYREILEFFKEVHQRMTNVAQQDDNAFIREIIDHSGLLTKISDDDVYILAHRSIHEYFIAVQLARAPKVGKERLLAKADNLHWRQVIVFFASLDHAEVESFLKELMQVNLELAGYCVPSAQILSPELAEVLADALVQDIRKGAVAISLPALVSMTKSYRTPIRNIAMQRLTAVLGEVFQTESNQLAGLKEEDVPELLNQLANTGSLDVLPTCLRLSEMVSKPTDAVAPLWQCLNIPGLEQDRVLTARLIRLLLDLVMTPEGLEELQRQPGFAPDFVTPAVREAVYPFIKGQDLESNLITLLAWADRIRCNTF
ncbi:MAG: NACHT domain-containing protein [Lewinellaceae bacterium]|nr:NACHT domain-containing protein [Lewinellaceae bacterium]